MTTLGFSPGLVKLISNYLGNRSFRVVLGGSTTGSFDMINGVPQGSVLSPVLFNIYLHDIPLDDKILTTQFADDITLHLTHNDPRRAQNQFNIYLCRLTKYFNNWKLILSAKKSEFINIIGRVRDTGIKLRRIARRMKITLNGLLLNESKNIRLLGLQLQKNNTFTENVKIRLNKTRRARFALRGILSNKFVNIGVKTGLYKTYLRSILTYAAPVWCQPPLITAHQMELFRVFERSCLRSTANIRRERGSFKHIKLNEIYDKSGCQRIDRFIAQLHINFFEKCIKSKNKKFSYSTYGGRNNNNYKPIYYLYKLHFKNRLFNNDNLLIFHERYNRSPGLVCNTQQ